jgi:hypothetical protein
MNQFMITSVQTETFKERQNHSSFLKVRKEKLQKEIYKPQFLLGFPLETFYHAFLFIHLSFPVSLNLN